MSYGTVPGVAVTPMTATDFANSYVSWTVPPDPDDERVPGHKPWGNCARIQLDALCDLSHDTSGAHERFFLIVPCRTEWVYQEENLFQMPSGEYRVLYGRNRQLRLGTGMTCQPEQKNASTTNEGFTTLSSKSSTTALTKRFPDAATELT